MMKRITLGLVFLIFSLLLQGVIGPGAPTVTTTAVTSITETTAASGGDVTSDGGSAVTARGVCWGASADPTIADTCTTDGAGLGIFTSSIIGLTAATTYHVRAYATNSEGTGYGADCSFETTTPGGPTVTTTAATSITETTATSGGDVTSGGSSDVTARGVCWSTSENPTTSDICTTDGTGIGTFTSEITGLTAGTTYYVRAYATNSEATVYGDDVSFTTTGAPTVTTTAVTSISCLMETFTINLFCSALSGGDVTSGGSSDVTARGVCWSASADPTIANTCTIDGGGTGTFTSEIAGLTPATTYYVRAYATNSEGTGYGDDVEFSTSGGDGGWCSLIKGANRSSGHVIVWLLIPLSLIAYRRIFFPPLFR